MNTCNATELCKKAPAESRYLQLILYPTSRKNSRVKPPISFPSSPINSTYDFIQQVIALVMHRLPILVQRDKAGNPNMDHVEGEGRVRFTGSFIYIAYCTSKSGI